MYGRKKVNTLAKEYENVLDIYEVDKYGNVYGANGIELKQGYNSSGYKQVSLKIKDKRCWKKCLVHRLVGYGFVKGYNKEYSEIDHKDTNKENNKYYNLKWTNRKGNMSNENTKNKMRGINGKKCYVYDYLLNFIGVFDSMLDAEKEIQETIRGINTRTKTHYILDLSLIHI